MTRAAAVLVPNERGSALPDLLHDIGELVRRRNVQIGDQLPSIREMSTLLGAKVSAVREAILRAQVLGLVRVLPRAGAFLVSANFETAAATPASAARRVPALDHEPNVFHLIETRSMIEVQTASLAAERRRLEELLPTRRALEGLVKCAGQKDAAGHVDCDIRFHMEIARLTGNTVLLALEQQLMERLRPLLLEMRWTAERFAFSQRSHTMLFGALVAGDAKRARRLMQRHLQLAYQNLLHDIQRPVELAALA